MTPKERKKLAKIVYNYYWKNDQHIYVTTDVVMDKDSCCLDICLYNQKEKYADKYLFEIRNYNAYSDVELVGSVYDENIRWYKTWDSVLACNKPYYMDRVFLLPKFTGITKADILKATKKFVQEELDCGLLFNFEVITTEEDNKEGE